MDEVNKILNDYISSHSKNFDFFNCKFNTFKANIKTKYFYNTDILNINLHLSYSIDCFKSRGHKFYNINQLTINIISDRCNMSYEIYINNPMPMVERRLNLNFARNPELINSLDRIKTIL